MRPPVLLATALLAATRLAGAPPTVEPEPDPAPRTELGTHVSAIELDVTLDPATGLLRERASVTVRGSGETSLRFALDPGLVVEKAVASSGFAEHRRSGSDVVVDLDSPLEGEIRIVFVVTGTPRREGLPLIRPSYAVLGPWDRWYPSLPSCWATTEVTVHVPADWGAIAPGARKKGTWSTSRPVRTIAIAAAPGLSTTETSIAGGVLRVATCEGAGPSPSVVAERLRDGWMWLSAALAPYPFDGFNAAFVPGFEGRVRAGGLVVAGADAPLLGPSDGADLLAGQWFGERLAGDGPWIEAWASWQAVVFARDRALPLPTAIERWREAYRSRAAGDVPLASANAATPPDILLGKGSAAPDMILLHVESRDLFAALRKLFSAPLVAPLSLEDLRRAIEKESGASLERAFDDWFRGTGIPEIEASMRTFPAAGGGFRVDLTLVQKSGTYSLPLEVAFLGPGETHRETIEISEPRTALVYDLPFEPVRVEVDPGRKVFRRD